MLGRTWLRLALLCTALSGIVVLGLGAFALSLSQKQYKTERVAAFDAAGLSITAKLKADRSVTQEWLSQTEQNNNIKLFVLDSGRSLLYGSNFDDYSDREKLLAAAEKNSGINIGAAPKIGSVQQLTYDFEADGKYYSAYAYKTAEAPPWYSFLAVQDKTEEHFYLQKLSRDYIILCALAITALFAVSLFFSHIALSPARRAAKKQSEFIAAASHELKSPLAVISASAAALTAKPDKTMAMAANIESECARLGALVEDLQTLSSADAKAWRVHFTQLEPDTLVLNLCESLEPLCKKTGNALRTEIDSGSIPKINGDKARIEQILTALINNAISYAPKSEITVSVKPHGKGVEISVSDKGPGVADKDKKKIFDRFYRADKSRTDKSHFGLGLSVAKELALLHKGSLTVRDAQGGGACFVLNLNK